MFEDVKARHGFVALGTLLALLVLTAGAARAQQPDDLTGRVVDPSGAGVPSAKVWLIGGRAWLDPEIVAETATDADGAFSFAGVWADKDHLPGYSLAARDPQGRLGGWLSAYPKLDGPVRIELSDPVQAQGRLIDQNGQPVAGAKIRPTSFARGLGDRTTQQDMRIPPEIGRSLATTSDADGSFSLQGIPPGFQVQVLVSRPGFGNPRVSWDSRRPATITLDSRLGSVEGRLSTQDGQPLPAGLSLSLELISQPGSVKGRLFSLEYHRTLEVGPDGRYRFANLPPGLYKVYAGIDPDTGYEADPYQILGLEIRPDTHLEARDILLKPLVTITGRVVDAETGEGLAGVRTNAYQVSSGPRFENADTDATDAQGLYTVHVRPGKVLVQPVSTLKSHLGLPVESCPSFEADADRDWPDLELPRAVSLEGTVVDRRGRPVKNAEIHALKRDLTSHPLSSTRASSVSAQAPAGSFRIGPLDPAAAVPLRARTKDATTKGALIIGPGKQRDKLSVEVDPENASHVHGVLVDDTGQPISGARVRLRWGREFAGESGQTLSAWGLLETIETGSDGRFRSSALWPGDTYSVEVEAEGYSRSDSSTVVARAGVDHDFGTFRLLGIHGHLAGRVVDTSDRAVPGALVFNSGDGPDRVQTLSDAEGRFRLDGLYTGGKYVFVRKDGYQFLGVRAEGDADGLSLTLRRLNEPPLPWTPAEPASREEETAIARRILVKVWDRYGGPHAQNHVGSMCLSLMARLDPDLARKWADGPDGLSPGFVVVSAETLAPSDPDAAIDVLRISPLVQSSPAILQRTLERLAEALVEQAPTSALRLVEEAAVQGRAMDPPDRSAALARTGALLVRLGREDAGKALVREAADALDLMDYDAHQDRPRSDVASAVAPFDLKRALSLVEPITDPRLRDRILARIASSLINTGHPDQALGVAGKISQEALNYFPVQIGVVHTLGLAGRLEDAEQVIQGITGRRALTSQAAAYAWLAQAVAPRDQKRAIGYIDQALAIPVQRPDDIEVLGDAPGLAAWIASIALEVGYPDMASVTARILASRPPLGNHGASMAVYELLYAAETLAYTDPAAARQFLTDLQTRWNLRATEGARPPSSRAWLSAWALADPKHAETLFEADFAALKDQPDANVLQAGLLAVPQALLHPRFRRLDNLRQLHNNLWYPGMKVR